jgi:hypothetical protein
VTINLTPFQANAFQVGIATSAGAGSAQAFMFTAVRV